MERESPHAIQKTAGESMNAAPKAIGASELATRALSIMESKKITSLVVIDRDNHVEGILHLHDLWGV